MPNKCLEFKDADCKNCYKCLRECPVQAIAVINHQARIIEDRCILCGKCTRVCPQNAKNVHSERDEVEALLHSGQKVIASVAPSFVSSFGISNFNLMKMALCKLGLSDAEETAVGANAVTMQYKTMLEGGGYTNFITSACPAINKLIQLYYPKALPYLARCDTPMIAHAKILKERYPDAKIVFVGPCIAKKREAQDSGLISAVLTFEDLSAMLQDKSITFDSLAQIETQDKNGVANRAKFYPIGRGIIKSFDILPAGYEYVAVDGLHRCMDVLNNIESIKGVFLEMNACDFSCVNGPCSLTISGGAVKANAMVRDYVSKDISTKSSGQLSLPNVDLTAEYPKLRHKSIPVTERETKRILAEIGKTKPEHELNCGACGYNTCREKAWAVANGYAEAEMCLPYMRERAETMSYEIIQNNPNGIIVVDFDLKITDMSLQARKLLGVTETDVKGVDLVNYMNPTDFMLAQLEGKNTKSQRITIERTKIVAEISITVLKEHKVMFGVLKDITEDVNFGEKLNKVRLETVATADEVIMKQMRVAQEIASLLGETTAETKVALLKLKKALLDAEGIEKGN